MRRPLVAFLLAALAACSEPGSKPRGEKPGPPVTPQVNPFVLGLAVNHDGSQRVIRGWPLVIRVSATFDRAPAGPVALPDSALQLRVLDASGADEAVALEAPQGVDEARVIDGARTSVEVVRVLAAAVTRAMEAGPRTVVARWGPATRTFAIAVEDPPPDSPAAREARAMLESDELLSRGQAAAAVASLDRALASDAGSIVLLDERAFAREQAGDDAGALEDARAALAAFDAAYPDATEPPVTILETIERVVPRLVGGAP